MSRKKKGAFLLHSAKSTPKNVSADYFLQDPLVADLRPNVGISTTVIDGEAVIGDGPTNSRVAVVDYNGDLDIVFEPAKLNSKGDGFSLGRKKPIDNLQFHQVNTWAIINNTIRQMESAKIFGRRIPWAFDRGRLLVLPHAGYWENAYYDRSTGALHFFYFEGPDGKPVYTCLSHDIVTHELGHAILDGLKPYYNEVSSPSTAGFHEFFGDAVAMTTSLFNREMVVEVAGRVGTLRGDNLIAGIAAQFGQAVNQARYGDISEHYLRSGNNNLTMDDLAGVYQEHDYSEVLIGVYYDLLVAFYRTGLEAILKKARMAAPTPENGGHRVSALMTASKVSARMILRAIDYCNPVDISYSDYARAVITADKVAYPVDVHGYREVATNIFLCRKLVATEDELRQQPEHNVLNDELRGLDISQLSASYTDAYHFVDGNRQILRIPPDANIKIVDLCKTSKRAANDRRLPRETIIQFVWPESVALSGPDFGDVSGAEVTLWCGGTMVLDREGNLLHYTLKENTQDRRQTLHDYMAYLIREGLFSLNTGETGLGSRAQDSNVVVGTIDAGVLRTHRSAAFRHTHKRRG